MDKNIIKKTMPSLEGAALQSAREKYVDYVADVRLDRSEPIERDVQAQAEIASDLSEALHDALHDHTDKLDKLREIDFGPKSTVTEGALVRFLSEKFEASANQRLEPMGSARHCRWELWDAQVAPAPTGQEPGAPLPIQLPSQCGSGKLPPHR